MTAGLALVDAARALGVRKGTLRRWVREGCPVVSRGRRGRGHALRVDPAAVRQWRGVGERERAILELADALPRLTAQATFKAFQLTEGLDKRRLAGAMAATWYANALCMLDYLRGQCPAVPDVTTRPEEIENLLKIAR